MTEKQLKEIQDHRDKTFELIFDRSIWKRADVRQFGLGIKKSSPKFFQGMTPTKVILKFESKEQKEKLVPELMLIREKYEKGLLR